MIGLGRRRQRIPAGGLRAEGPTSTARLMRARLRQPQGPDAARSAVCGDGTVVRRIGRSRPSAKIGLHQDGQAPPDGHGAVPSGRQRSPCVPDPARQPSHVRWRAASAGVPPWTSAASLRWVQSLMASVVTRNVGSGLRLSRASGPCWLGLRGTARAPAVSVPVSSPRHSWSASAGCSSADVALSGRLQHGPLGIGWFVTTRDAVVTRESVSATLPGRTSTRFGWPSVGGGRVDALPAGRAPGREGAANGSGGAGSAVRGRDVGSRGRPGLRMRRGPPRSGTKAAQWGRGSGW